MDFFDQLKSISSGYGSLDYEVMGFEQSDLVKLDILVAGDRVDELSVIVHMDNAYHIGRELALRLRKIVPRQNFEVPIQATIGKRIIAKERVAPYRKDVTAKLYGGDVTRKKKLLEKQKKGKKRMKKIGRVDIPDEAFMSFYEISSEK